MEFDQYDIVTQQFTSNHVTVSADGKGWFPRIPFRYSWPAEMDLMARIAARAAGYWTMPGPSRCRRRPARAR